MQSPNPAAEPITRFAMVETTLREGEQFATARFTSEQRQAIAQALDVFGVEYLELTSPAASPKAPATSQLSPALA